MTGAPALAAAALQQAAAVLATLTPQQLEDLASGRGQLVFRAQGTEVAPAARRRRAAPATAGDGVATAVAAIGALATAGEVADYLEQHDQQLTMPVLREIARALGPTVSAAGRSKADLKRNIVEGTAGFRERTAAMSGGAWS